MQNKKYPAQTWDTSNHTDRRKEGEGFPKHHYFTRTKGTAELRFSGADNEQIKVGINNWILLSLSSGEQVEASR